MNAQLLRVDMMLDALSGNPLAVRIRADQSDARQRKGGSQFGKVNQDIERTAAIADGFGLNIGQGVLLGIGVDKLQLVDNPIASREDAGACAHVCIHARISLTSCTMAGSSS